MTDSPLMLVKVLLIVAGGAAFVWWQFRDLAREKELTTAQDKQLGLLEPSEPVDHKDN